MRTRRTGSVPFLTAVAVAALAAAGCGGPSPGDASGTVRYNGWPLVCGSVIFYGSDGLPHAAAIGPDGTYSVTGVPSGEVKVAVVSELPSATAPVKKQAADGKALRQDVTPPAPKAAGRPRGWFPVPKKFGDATTSGLTITIDAGPNTQDISLND
jgi:hypothetical protein